MFCDLHTLIIIVLLALLVVTVACAYKSSQSAKKLRQELKELRKALEEVDPGKLPRKIRKMTDTIHDLLGDD